MKARRSFGVSMAILLVGFIAVVGALVYRAYRDSGEADTRYALEQASLPSGADLVSVSTAEGLVTLAYTIDGKTEVRIIDGTTGELVRHFAVVTK